MIPRIAQGGHSFKGAYQYFCHDKGQSTKDRVLWTHTENMQTEDPDLAWKVMAYTAIEQDRLKEASGQKATGRKLQKPVFSYSLAWHPEQDPDRDHMLETARKSLAKLGMMEFETLIVAHRDEPQRHVHIIVNRVHPITGLAADLSNTKKKLSEFAHAYEQDNGKIYCKQREENIQKRKEGEKTSYADVNIQEAWTEAVSGQSFAQGLKKRGYQLALGRKRLVVVDPQGKILNPTRHLKGVRAKDIKVKLSDVRLHELFDAASLSQQIRQKQKQDYQARQKEARQAKPKEPAAVLLNRMQNRHIEERAQLFNRHYDLIEKEQETLNDYYKMADRREVIDGLVRKTTNPSIWRRLFGMAREDRRQLEQKKDLYEQAQDLIKERLKFLENERDKELALQAQRHHVEKEILYHRGSEKAPVTPYRSRYRKKKKEQEYDFDR